MKYQYFIWDVGGTLFDTLKTSVKAFAQVLEEFHLQFFKSIIYQKMKETSTEEAAKFFVGAQNLDRFINRYHELEASMQKNPDNFPDTKQTLKTIVEKGGENYVISHRNLQVVDFLKSKHLLQYFSYIITKNDGFPRKPSPVSIQYLFNHFGVKAQKTLFIGDRALDVMAGKNAGVKTALYSTDDLLKVKEADYVIHRLTEVLFL
ncbi:MAG: HAD-IA family hydrolase [Lactobacillales bacterium]|jgi:HAD superfamily hydrolase (TIGR01549 family)|nr:HAD-IA family hydrolase [Lactobacillales bacterium]